MNGCLLSLKGKLCLPDFPYSSYDRMKSVENMGFLNARRPESRRAEGPTGRHSVRRLKALRWPINCSSGCGSAGCAVADRELHSRDGKCSYDADR